MTGIPLDELRIYTVAASGLAEYLRLAEQVAVPVRGDDYGQLLGFWHAEIGSAFRVFNLWRHVDLQTRQAVRARLERLEAWQRDYVAHVHPLMQEQEIRLMNAVAPLAPPAGDGRLYEARLIRAKVGKAPLLAAALRDEHPDGDAEAAVGLWTTFAGRLNEVVQLIAYPDAAARLRNSLSSRAWQGFLARHGDGIDRMESSLLLPAPHSPMR